MGQSRSYFVELLQKSGFAPYKPKGDIFRYIPREFYKFNEIVVGMSEKGTSIEVSVYHTGAKTVKKFSDYSGSWQEVDKLLKSPVSVVEAPAPEPTTRTKRKG